ncbi:unnamed protein product [Rhodiola kirilowii]
MQAIRAVARWFWTDTCRGRVCECLLEQGVQFVGDDVDECADSSFRIL